LDADDALTRSSCAASPRVAGVIVVTFLLTRVLPRDPAVHLAKQAATQQAIAQIRHLLREPVSPSLSPRSGVA
jgi:ABC-type dipeptide/oligopeptide/nickel transport system permease component